MEEAAAVEVEEEEVMEGEDQFGLTSINIDVFFSLFKVDFQCVLHSLSTLMFI